MPPKLPHDQVLGHLKRQNVALEAELSSLRERLRAETQKRELAEQAARDGWAFARTALHGGHRPKVWEG